MFQKNKNKTFLILSENKNKFSKKKVFFLFLISKREICDAALLFVTLHILFIFLFDKISF